MGKKNERGWIKLYRQLDELDFYFSERFSKVQAWIDILLLATHKPRTVFIRGIEIKLKPGELAWSITSLAKRWRWNERTVKRFLNMLEERQMIHRKSDNVSTIISVKNWNEYQKTTEQNTEQNTEQMQSRIQTNKNDKNDKNDKKYIKKKSELKLVSEIYSYYQQRINPRSRLTDKAKEKIRVRLRSFSEDELKKAIDNFASDSWWMEHNAFRGVAWFFHSDDRIDQFLNLGMRSRKQLSDGQIEAIKSGLTTLKVLEEKGYDTSNYRKIGQMGRR